MTDGLVGNWYDYSFGFVVGNVLDFLLKDHQLWRIDLILKGVRQEGQHVRRLIKY